MSDPDRSAPVPSDEPLAADAAEAWQIEAQLPGLRAGGQHALVVALGERLLEIREAELGAAHDKTLEVVDALAESYFQMSLYERALGMLQRMLPAREAAGGAGSGHVLAQLAKVYRSMGALDRAEACYQRAIEVYEASPEPPLARVADMFHGLAVLHEMRDELGEAEATCRAALEIFEKVSGSEGVMVAEAMCTLAVIHRKKGDAEEAERLGLRALAIQEARQGRDHPGLATVLVNLAGFYTAKGQHDRAGELLARASALLDARGGPPDVVTAAVLDILGVHRAATGDHAGAIDAARRSLAIREELLGPSHPTVALSLNNLGVKLCADRATHAEAEALLRRALFITPAASAGPTLQSLARVRVAAGDLDEAEALANRDLRRAREHAGPDHPDTATALDTLSQLAEVRGDVTRALELMQGAFRIRSARPALDRGIADMTRIGELMLAANELDGAAGFLDKALDLAAGSRGPDDPTVSHLMFLAGKVALARKNPKRALFYIDRALAIDEKANGRTHPALVSLIDLQARAAVELGKLGVAEAAYLRIDGIMDEHPPPAPETRAIVPALLGEIAMKRKAYAKAAQLFERALAITERAFGRNDPRLSTMLQNAADAQAAAGALPRAGELLRRLLAIYEHVLGADEAAMLPVVRRLADVYMKTGDARAEEMVKRTLGSVEAATRETRAETSRIWAESARRKGRS